MENKAEARAETMAALDTELSNVPAKLCEFAIYLLKDRGLLT
jgi:hypothetical protein